MIIETDHRSNLNFKSIHIGPLIKQRASENEIEVQRICNFFKCDEAKITEMYLHENMTTDILLKWSKLLEYDFFRIYSQHLILFAPQGSREYNKSSAKKKSKLPHFRKNIYTQEIIDYILELIETKEMSIQQVIDQYRIPKTTIYRWIKKYKPSDFWYEN